MAGSLTRIVAYQVQQDGNWDPVSFKKVDLKVKQVFILVNDGRKELWIWIGEGADVRTRFISSTAAAEIRRLYGLTLRVRTADQGSEPKDFWKCMDLIPKRGLGPDVQEGNRKSSKTVLKESTTRKIIKRAPSRQIKNKKTTPKPKLKSKLKEDQKEQISPSKELKGDTSLVSTPPCPQCKRGFLLPYSKVVKVSARKKEVLQYASWVCSNCNFSPKSPDFDEESKK